MSKAADFANEFLNSLATEARTVAAEVLPNLSPETADLIGEEVAVRVSQKLGGGGVYLAKGRIYQARRSDDRITNDFYHHPDAKFDHKKVATLHGVTAKHVYAVVARVIARERAERQATLTLEQ